MVRGVLIEPVLFLALTNETDALHATTQHICLARNEDILYPDEEIIEISETEFDTNDELFAGFELIFEQSEKSFLVGYNRLKKNEAMYGHLKVVGNPVKTNY